MLLNSRVRYFLTSYRNLDLLEKNIMRISIIGLTMVLIILLKPSEMQYLTDLRSQPKIIYMRKMSLYNTCVLLPVCSVKLFILNSNV